MSLLCSACTINGQGTDSTKSIAKKSPKPTATFASTSRFSETQADGEISVGNIQIVSNRYDELRKLMRRYRITPNQIKQMLERYAEGGTARITKINNLDFKKFISERPMVPITPAQGKDRVLVTVGNLQILYSDELRTIMNDYLITPTEMLDMLERYAEGGAATMTKRVFLNLKRFISKRPIGPITSVSAITDSLPGGASMTIDTRPQHHLDSLFSEVVSLRKQIKLLNKKRDALNDLYRLGLITIQTRNEDLMRNRMERSVLETDLEVLQSDIGRIARIEPVVQINNVDDDEELFES